MVNAAARQHRPAPGGVSGEGSRATRLVGSARRPQAAPGSRETASVGCNACGGRYQACLPKEGTMATPPDLPQESKRVTAGVLGILIGGLGIHRFILGDTTGGILRIVITVVTCGFGSLIGLVEGIIYLTKSEADFVRIYQVEKKAWF
jgi:TM2 domain-containing membrane protein YozV